MDWAGKKVVVTGISGFLGKHVAARLTAHGAGVTGVSRTAPAVDGIADAVPFQPLDLRDFAATRSLIESLRPDAVFHLAAVSVLQAGTADGGARAMLETNVAATWNVLEACRGAGTPVLVVASSDKQYGALAAPPYDDADGAAAFANGGLYELSKAQQDQAARLYAGLYDVPAVRVARLANVYGPGDRQWTRIVPGTLRRAVQGEAPRVTAGPAGAALREYVYVTDAVHALLALAADAAARGNAPTRRGDGRLARAAWNVGSPHRYPAADVIATLQRLLRDEFAIDAPPPVVQPGPEGVFEPGHQYSDLTRLKELIPGWNPLGLADGLRRTVPWYLGVL